MKSGLVENLTSDIEASPLTPDEKTKDEKRSIYQDQWDEATLKNFLLNQAARKEYSFKIFIMTISWLGLTVLILLLSGFKLLSLTDTVLVTLLGTTTVTVLGFFVIVTQYLFNKDKST